MPDFGFGSLGKSMIIEDSLANCDRVVVSDIAQNEKGGFVIKKSLIMQKCTKIVENLLMVQKIG